MPDSFYENIELTESEKQAALLEWRKRKYFHEKNKAYWEQQEKPTKKLLIEEYKQKLK